MRRPARQMITISPRTRCLTPSGARTARGVRCSSSCAARANRGDSSGEVGFDERGDIREGAETIVRVVGGKRGTGIASLSGVAVEDVIPVSPAMVG